MNKIEQILEALPDISRAHHQGILQEHCKLNKPFIKTSIKAISVNDARKKESAIVISAGPSLKRRGSLKKIKESGYQGTIVTMDGAYVACLDEGIIPDYVLTLDPHPTRIVRWFGDPNVVEHSRGDDYYERQDLNIDFRKDMLRKNKENILLVNRYANRTAAVVCTSVHQTVTQRILEAGFDVYWWHPLVDDPTSENSITKELYDMIKLPCMNTGGTVGIASYLFTSQFLSIPRIALVGMDFGYHIDLPIEKTQMYYEMAVEFGIEKVADYMKHFTCELTGEQYYTDPTYLWYKNNFVELLKKDDKCVVNCTEGGILSDAEIPSQFLLDFLQVSI